jgi:hypothetical protein
VPTTDDVSYVLRYVALPALAPAAIVGLYFTPLSVVDCVTRGLLALGVALLAAVAAFVSIGMSARSRRRGGGDTLWWLLSAAVLAVPLALLLGPLG